MGTMMYVDVQILKARGFPYKLIKIALDLFNVTLSYHVRSPEFFVLFLINVRVRRVLS